MTFKMLCNKTCIPSKDKRKLASAIKLIRVRAMHTARLWKCHLF